MVGGLTTGGDEYAATQPGAFWAKITGNAAGTNRYAWTQIDTGDTAAFDTGLADDFAATGTSDENGAPAYEVNGRTDVATGTRVLLYPMGDYTFYGFIASTGGTVTSGEVILSAAYDITADNTWEDTGLEVELPENGTYLIICEAVAQGRVTTFSGGTDRAGVYAGLSYGTDMTSPVAYSLATMVRSTGTPSTFARTSFGAIFEATSGTGLTLKLLAKRDAASTWAIARLDVTTDSVTDGETRVKWVKLTNTPGGGGPPGPTGATGATGPTGPAGADGATNPEAENAVVGLQVYGP